MKKLVAMMATTLFLTGCVSPSYCKGLAVDPDHSDFKCAAAVGADVVLVALAVVTVVGVAQSSGDSSSSDYTETTNESPKPFVALQTQQWIGDDLKLCSYTDGTTELVGRMNVCPFK